MPTIVKQDFIGIEPDDDSPRGPAFKVCFPEGTELFGSPDETCELICDLVAEQFWDWFQDPAHRSRFKPRVKILEVW
ncbi:MAG: hypothetical protein WBC44_10605 [Planctomycetaceae bacterium]